MENIDREIEFACNGDKFVVLSSAHTTIDTITRINALGFTNCGVHGSRHIWRVPINVKRDAANIYHLDETPLFKVYINRNKCWCVEYHWDPYKGGDWSAIQFYGDPDWNTKPPYPSRLPLTPEMIEMREKEYLAAQEATRRRRKRILAREHGHSVPGLDDSDAFIDAVANMRDNLREAANMDIVRTLAEAHEFKTKAITKK